MTLTCHVPTGIPCVSTAADGSLEFAFLSCMGLFLSVMKKLSKSGSRPIPLPVAQSRGTSNWEGARAIGLVSSATAGSAGSTLPGRCDLRGVQEERQHRSVPRAQRPGGDLASGEGQIGLDWGTALHRDWLIHRRLRA